MFISEQTITERISQLSVPSRIGVKNTLEPMTALLDRLDHPERKFRSIHIGGTSGKGSTSTFLANILSDAGYKVGLFTKPHLFSVRERFVINGQLIPPEKILSLLDRMAERIDEKPTWFELTTAIAFQYFADQEVDFGVIEVGLGGSFDATNEIVPELSVLTNVGLDHTDVLGDTVEKIATDKVGIIKPGKPVVSGVWQPSVIEIVEAQCRRTRSDLIQVERDFCSSNISLTQHGGTFDFEFGAEKMSGLTISVLGKHQIKNAALACAAAVILRRSGYTLPESALRSGLNRTLIPGRMEILQSEPMLLLDGAHSSPKMQAFVEGIQDLFTSKLRIIGVLAFSTGHDLQATLSPLASILDTTILTEFNAETDYGNKRAQNPDEVSETLRTLNPAIHLFCESDPILALGLAQNMAGPDDLICVTGSIFLVGQIRHFLTIPNGVTYVPNS